MSSAMLALASSCRTRVPCLHPNRVAAEKGSEVVLCAGTSVSQEHVCAGVGIHWKRQATGQVYRVAQRVGVILRVSLARHSWGRGKTSAKTLPSSQPSAVGRLLFLEFLEIQRTRTDYLLIMARTRHRGRAGKGRGGGRSRRERRGFSAPQAAKFLILWVLNLKLET